MLNGKLTLKVKLISVKPAAIDHHL